MIMFLPIIIIVCLLVLLSLIIFRVNTKTKRSFATGKTGYWLLAGYTGLLIAAAVFFVFTPEQNASSMDIQKAEASYDWERYEQMLLVGDLHELPEDWVFKSEEWKVTMDQLTVEKEGEIGYELGVYVDQSEDYETIEAIFFRSPIVVRGMEVVPEEVPRFSLIEETLTVQWEGSRDIRFNLYEPPMMIQRFMDGEGTGWDYSDAKRGVYGVYIKAPEGLDIEVADGSSIRVER
ncbi:hypothetical protein LCM20_15630 [Halobacillus litoralis]|uniref:hypothetical protein n=1 Tax=Halobacillus litoralis TaxID=45668 RepID=UPI001CD62987|nr:hypothetical protein [Halobacillus litoralis]MCA0972037.1 hypothetical protein [Halobacillus litoralis]